MTDPDEQQEHDLRGMARALFGEPAPKVHDEPPDEQEQATRDAARALFGTDQPDEPERPATGLLAGPTT